jgi:hypothetical protein
MLRKTLSTVLACLISFVCVIQISANAGSGKQDQAEKVKAKIAKIGTGPKARVKVKLKDGTSLQGHINKIEDNGFELIADKSGTVNSVSYTDVSQVKTVVENPFSDPKVWLGLALIPAIIVIAVVAKGVD